MLDVQNVQRGACKEQDCDCNDYTIIESVKNFLCMYCGHYPARHIALQQVSLTSTSLPDTKNTTTTITNSTSTNTENVLYVKSEDLDEPELSNEAQSESPVHDSQEENTEVVADVGLSGVNERSYERYHSPCDDYANYNDTPEPYQQMYAEKSHTSFNLPPFSEYVQPYLNGTATDRQISGMRNQLISELIDYLDDQSLLASKNPVTQSWGSRRLQSAILLQYPNIIKERSKSKNGKQRSKGELGMLVTRVLDYRRRRKKDAKKLAEMAQLSGSSCIRVEEDEELNNFLQKGTLLRVPVPIDEET